MTILELMITLLIIGLLSAVAMPVYNNYRDRMRNSQAASDILVIEVLVQKFFNDNSRYPDTLAAVNGDWTDPWGNPYRYLRIAGALPGSLGGQRKDRNLVPVNSDFDLYSMGKDGVTSPPFTAARARDDVVRAQNGAFVGLAKDY